MPVVLAGLHHHKTKIGQDKASKGQAMINTGIQTKNAILINEGLQGIGIVAMAHDDWLIPVV